MLPQTHPAADPWVHKSWLVKQLSAVTCGRACRSIEEDEYCLIPMGGVLPRVPQRVLGIGGTAGMVHPSTGAPQSLPRNFLDDGAGTCRQKASPVGCAVMSPAICRTTCCCQMSAPIRSLECAMRQSAYCECVDAQGTWCRGCLVRCLSWQTP